MSSLQSEAESVRCLAVPIEYQPTPFEDQLLIDLALVTATNRLAKRQGLTLRQQVNIWRPFS